MTSSARASNNASTSTVSTTYMDTKEIEKAPTIDLSNDTTTSEGESKERESFQWKPNQSTRKHVVHDYTEENSQIEGAVSLALPYVHKRVRPEKVFAVMRSPYMEVDGEIRKVNLCNFRLYGSHHF